jgi:hypothetical protein
MWKKWIIFGIKPTRVSYNHLALKGLFALNKCLLYEADKGKNTGCIFHHQCQIQSCSRDFPFNINTSITRVKNVVTSKREFKWGLTVTKWSDVEWIDLICVKLFCLEVKLSELRWSSCGQMCHLHKGDLILRVYDCVVTISFGVHLVLRFS